MPPGRTAAAMQATIPAGSRRCDSNIRANTRSQSVSENRSTAPTRNVTLSSCRAAASCRATSSSSSSRSIPITRPAAPTRRGEFQRDVAAATTKIDAPCPFLRDVEQVQEAECSGHVHARQAVHSLANADTSFDGVLRHDDLRVHRDHCSFDDRAHPRRAPLLNRAGGLTPDRGRTVRWPGGRDRGRPRRIAPQCGGSAAWSSRSPTHRSHQRPYGRRRVVHRCPSRHAGPLRGPRHTRLGVRNRPALHRGRATAPAPDATPSRSHRPSWSLTADIRAPDVIRRRSPRPVNRSANGRKAQTPCEIACSARMTLLRAAGVSGAHQVGPIPGDALPFSCSPWGGNSIDRARAGRDPRRPRPLRAALG